MTQNPIQFLSEDGDPKQVQDTEMGGASGLIQPARGDGAFLGSPESKGGHDLELGDNREIVSDVHGVVARAAMDPLSPSEQVTGVPDVPGTIRDPHTGRVAPDTKNAAGGGGKGELSSLKP